MHCVFLPQETLAHLTIGLYKSWQRLLHSSARLGLRPLAVLTFPSVLHLFNLLVRTSQALVHCVFTLHIQNHCTRGLPFFAPRSEIVLLNLLLAQGDFSLFPCVNLIAWRPHCAKPRALGCLKQNAHRLIHFPPIRCNTLCKTTIKSLLDPHHLHESQMFSFSAKARTPHRASEVEHAPSS